MKCCDVREQVISGAKQRLYYAGYSANVEHNPPNKCVWKVGVTRVDKGSREKDPKGGVSGNAGIQSPEFLRASPDPTALSETFGALFEFY